MKSTKILLLVFFIDIVFINNIFGFNKIDEKIFNLKDFTEIKIDTDNPSIEIYIEQNENFYFKIEGENSIINEIESIVENNSLILKSAGLCCNHGNSNINKVKISIKMPKIFNFINNGSSNIFFENKWIQNENINIIQNGSGDIKGNFEISFLNIILNGSGNINLNGKTENFISKIIGSGNIKCENFTSIIGNFVLDGSGNMYCNVLNKLTLLINGSGNVKNIGKPELKINIYGSGDYKSI